MEKKSNNNINEIIENMKRLNFNFTDMKILFFLCNSQGKENLKLSITELQSKVGIAYKNLKPHLDKLEKEKMINVIDYGKGRKKEVSINEKPNVLSFILGIFILFEIKEMNELLEFILKKVK